jgi:hypothetical protein
VLPPAVAADAWDGGPPLVSFPDALRRNSPRLSSTPRHGAPAKPVGLGVGQVQFADSLPGIPERDPDNGSLTLGDLVAGLALATTERVVNDPDILR